MQKRELLKECFALVLSGSSCPANWHYYNDNCYFVSDDNNKANRNKARKICQAVGADLVSISDEAEMDFVLSISYELFMFVLSLPVRLKQIKK